jgi:hypothetical protein
MFDWLPEPHWLWLLVLWGVCIVIAALLIYDPCQTNLFSAMSSQCQGGLIRSFGLP